MYLEDGCGGHGPGPFVTVHVVCTSDLRARLFAITCTAHEAQLHGAKRRARRRGSLPESRPAPKLSHAPPRSWALLHRRSARRYAHSRSASVHPCSRAPRAASDSPKPVSNFSRVPSPPSRNWSPPAPPPANSERGPPDCCGSRSRLPWCRSCSSRCWRRSARPIPDRSGDRRERRTGRPRGQGIRRRHPDGSSSSTPTWWRCH